MNVFVVKQGTHMKELIPICDEIICKHDFKQLSLMGEGKAVNKTISISEILKKKYNLTDAVALSNSDSKENEPALTIILKKSE